MFKENVGAATSSQADQEGEQPVLMDISKHTTLVDNIDTLINIPINILGSGGNPDEGEKIGPEGDGRRIRNWKEGEENGGRELKGKKCRTWDRKRAGSE